MILTLSNCRQSADQISQSLSFHRNDSRGQSKGSSVTSDNVETVDLPGTSKEKTKQNKSGPFMRLLKMSRADWKYVVTGTIGSTLAGCTNPSYAFLISSALSAFYNPDKAYMKRHLRIYSLCLVGLGLAAPFIYTLQHYSLGIAGERLVERARLLMFRSKFSSASRSPETTLYLFLIHINLNLKQKRLKIP